MVFKHTIANTFLSLLILCIYCRHESLERRDKDSEKGTELGSAASDTGNLLDDINLEIDDISSDDGELVSEDEQPGTPFICNM